MVVGPRSCISMIISRATTTSTPTAAPPPASRPREGERGRRLIPSEPESPELSLGPDEVVPTSACLAAGHLHTQTFYSQYGAAKQALSKHNKATAFAQGSSSHRMKHPHSQRPLISHLAANRTAPNRSGIRHSQYADAELFSEVLVAPQRGLAVVIPQRSGAQAGCAVRWL